MQTLEREHTAALSEVVVANADLTDRLRSEGAAIYYDPDGDVFALAIGEPTESAILEVDDVLWLRVDPEVPRLLGFEIPSLQAFSLVHPHVAAILRPLLAYTHKAPATFVRVPIQTAGTIAEEIRELLPA